MKTLLLLGAMLVILDAAIVPMSAQTASASPAATVSPHPTPGGASPNPRPTLAASPFATGVSNYVWCSDIESVNYTRARRKSQAGSNGFT